MGWAGRDEMRKSRCPHARMIPFLVRTVDVIGGRTAGLIRELVQAGENFGVVVRCAHRKARAFEQYCINRLIYEVLNTFLCASCG